MCSNWHLKRIILADIMMRNKTRGKNISKDLTIRK